jgi:hypothetical protein
VEADNPKSGGSDKEEDEEVDGESSDCTEWESVEDNELGGCADGEVVVEEEEEERKEEEEEE